MVKYSSIILIAAVSSLTALGLIMLASTGAWAMGDDVQYHYLIRQAIMALIGLLGAITATRFPVDKIRKYVPWLAVISCVLLILCILPGVGREVLGARRWLDVPILGKFQPSEVVKIVVIFILATWFFHWQAEVKSFLYGFLIPSMITAPIILLIAAGNDVGTALGLIAAVIAIFVCVGTRLLYLVPASISAIAAASWLIYHSPNRWSRIQAWIYLDDPTYQIGKGLQQWRALLALGNGGPWGVGLGNGAEKFGTLPFAHSDFIFPVVGEELGLVTTLAVILCYVLITVSGFSIALQANTTYNRCLAIGATVLLVIPAMVNIGVTTAMLPCDGLPLPFVSYGGTSLISCMFIVGLLVCIHNRNATATIPTFKFSKSRKAMMRL